MDNGFDSGDPLSRWVLVALTASTFPVFYLACGFLLLGLLFLSAIISAAEISFFSLSGDERARCRISEDARERKIADLLDKPRLLLATMLIFNNLVNVAFITLATFLAWQAFGVDSLSGRVVVGLTLLTTFVIVFLGELIPKVYAEQKNLQLARQTVSFVNLLSVLLWPLSWLLTKFSAMLEKRLPRKTFTLSVDELNEALDNTAGEVTTEEEKEILRGVVNFANISAKQVMRARVDIVAFDMELDFHELMDKINKNGYSRVPIFRETLDKIEGILYIKDLLPYINQKEDFNWQQLLRPGYFIPEGKKLSDLLNEFQQKQVHMALVVDEYGGTLGLITLEDIIEEIVGEINDEFDEESVNYSQVDAGTYIFEGKTLIHDFCKVLSTSDDVFDSIKGESESLGGLLLELFSRIPKVNEQVKYEQFTFVVLAVDAKKIRKIKVIVDHLLAAGA